MGRYIIHIGRFEPLRSEHRNKQYRIDMYHRDLAVLDDFSDLLKLDLSPAGDYYPRLTDWSSKTFKSSNPKIRNCVLGYRYSESTININHYTMCLEIRIKKDDKFVCEYFDDLVLIAQRLKGDRVNIECDDVLPIKGVLSGADSFINAISTYRQRIETYDLSTFRMISPSSVYPYEMDYNAAAERIQHVVEKLAVVENGLIFCAPTVTLDEKAYYNWNHNILTRLGLYGYGNLPTTRIYGKFYWDRDACPEFFAKIPDDLCTLLYQESPLKCKTTSYPINYSRSSPVLSIELPGIDDEVGEKEFWDLYLKKYLGEHNAAVELMMHQYDRFL